jgi:predicted O-linked N-acetylglucosamine transferase (SPINDLY family)
MPQTQLDAACAEATELQLAGQLELAEQLYRAILQAEPQHAAANYCFGMLHVQSLRPASGLPHLLAALQSNPSVSEYWLGYLEALLLADQTDEARSTLALGREHGLGGAAIDGFAERLAARLPPVPVPVQAPAPPVAPGTPGTPAKVSKASRRNESRLVREQESTLLALVDKRDFTAALTLARAMTERFPERGLAWKVVGAFVSTDGGHEESLAAMLTAVRLMPQDAEAHVNLGLTLAKMTRFEEAEFYLRKALDIKPGFAAAHYRLAMAYEWQGRFADAEASLRRGIALRTGYAGSDDELSYSNLLFLVSHNAAVGADELFAEHCRFGEYFESTLRAGWPTHSNVRDLDRRLRVGFVSGDFYNHAVSSFIEPILAELAGRPGLELHAYYSNVREDEVSRRLRGHFKRWTSVASSSDTQLANQVMADGIDILIDLSGHTGNNRLPMFARKPAPLQISWIGYPGTTGLQAMDYFLADPHFLPPGQFDRHFTEKLVQLPAQTPFQPHPSAPPVNSLPALAAGHMTFGSFNRLGKINDATIQVWSELLSRVPDAMMLIAGIPAGNEHRQLSAKFGRHGIDADRLQFHARCDMDQYLALYHRVDMCLDTTPYNGGTTTIHALWMGVPTLSIAGPTPAARSGAAILGQMDLHEFVASSAGDFLEKGVYWAQHTDELARFRAGLRERWQQSPGRRADVIAAAFESALRRMWQRWCQRLPAESFQAT